MKVLLTGGSGLVGTEIISGTRKGFEVIAPRHSELDITKPETILATLLKYKPDVVVNAAAVINMDKCEEDPKLCFGVNRDGVSNLLSSIKQMGRPMTFVQISSSEAFGRVNEGEYKINGYTEDDELRPAGNYQKSKAEAEKIVIEFGRPK